MTEHAQCVFIPAGRTRCPVTALWLAVGDGHHRKVCGRHLGAACRELSEVAPLVAVASLDRATLKTRVVNLSEATLQETGDMWDQLGKYVEVVLRQVERPRRNLGSTGPPGRED